MRNRGLIVAVLLGASLAGAVPASQAAVVSAPDPVITVIPGWTAVDLPAPHDATTDPTLVPSASGVACTAEACVAAGSYVSSSPAGGGGMLDSYNTQSWTSVLAPVPANAISNSSLFSVACGSTQCAALGQYSLPSSIGLVVETGLGTKWAAHQAPLPSPEWTYNHPGTFACAPNGSQCVFSGVYEPAIGATVEGFLDVGWGGSWKAVKAPLPAGAATQGPGIGFSSAACSGQTCIVTGSYLDNQGNRQGLIETYHGGTWTAFRVPPPAGMPAGNAVALNGATCRTASSCIVVGSWLDSINDSHVLIVTGLGATWKESSFRPPAGNQSGDLWNVTCPATYSCVASGSAGNSMMIAAWDGEANTWSGVLIPVASNALPGRFYPVYSGNIACASVDACIVVGGYTDKDYHTDPLVLTGSGLSWKAYNSPVPPNAVQHPDAHLTEVGCTQECLAFGSFTGNEQGSTVPNMSYVTVGVGSTCIPSAPTTAATTEADVEGNWGGYDAVSHECGFTQVTGQWTQPKSSCPPLYDGKSLHTSFWVGLDGGGGGSATVEQTGTINWCKWDDRSRSYIPSYTAWYEMLPAPPVYLTASPVTAGSQVEATVIYGGQGKYTLKLDITTKGVLYPFSKVLPCAITCVNTTAEWVIEKLATQPLTPGAPWTLTHGYATTAANASWQTIQALRPQKVTIVGPGGVLLGYPDELNGSTMRVVY